MISDPSLRDRRIALLLSGGVDSSVALYELVRRGLKPDCFYIKIGPEDNLSADGGNGDGQTWDCSAEEDLEMATAVSRKYGCSLEIVDCHRDYWDQVTRYTMEKVRNGFTPNPDVMCNRLIKFGAFHEKRGHEYDLIATGHYAQTEPAGISEGSGTLDAEQGSSTSPNSQLQWLCTSPDPVKDQTDFLAQIYGWQLQKALFPIGHMLKDEVRRIADSERLAPAHRRDSQGICFLGKIDYNEYLRRYLGQQQGDVVELETGRLIGHHQGHWFHTIGQRKGLGLGGGPWFVVKKDIQQNIIYVSHGYDPQTAYRQEFVIADFNSLIPTAGYSVPTAGNSVPAAGSNNGSGQSASAADRLLRGNVTIKIRHTPEFTAATIEPLPDGRYIIRAAEPIHGVAPGQFCVVYDSNHHRCYGSGEITI